MYRLFIIFIIHYSLLIINCYGQSITWQRLYDIPSSSVSYSYATCHADSGNFYSGGHAFISNLFDYRMCVIKLNPYGDTIWIRIIDTLALRINAMSSTGDGGCIITGDNNFSVKLSTSGSIVWAKYYGGDGIQLYDIIKTSDGGYIACGFQYDVNTFAHNGYLIKLDINGNMQWQQIYPSNDRKELNSIIQLADGNYAIAGSNSDYLADTTKILFLKVNSVGNIFLEKRYTVLGKVGIGLRINQINNQFVIGGNTRDSTGTKTNTCFIRIDTTGNLLYAKKYEMNRLEVFYDMKTIDIDKYIFLRQRSFGGNSVDSHVMVIDSVGNAFIEQAFSLDETVSFWSILLMPNGDFVFAGDGRTALPSPYRTFIVRTDSNLYAPPIGISNRRSDLPDSYILKQNYPNPFNSSTIIEFEIKKLSKVQIRLFDILGRNLINLFSSKLSPGSHRIQFDSNKYPSGIYFYQMLIDGNTVTTKKMVILK